MTRILTMLKTSARLIKRDQSRTSNQNRESWRFAIRKWAFNLSEYNKYGLYTHDVLDFEHPVIKEALRRLPKDVLDTRNFRFIRATQTNFLKVYLPKEKWITYEQDLEYRYLTPYINEIVAEKMEIYNFGCSNYFDYHWPANEIK